MIDSKTIRDGEVCLLLQVNFDVYNLQGNYKLYARLYRRSRSIWTRVDYARKDSVVYSGEDGRFQVSGEEFLLKNKHECITNYEMYLPQGSIVDGEYCVEFYLLPEGSNDVDFIDCKSGGVYDYEYVNYNRRDTDNMTSQSRPVDINHAVNELNKTCPREFGVLHDAILTKVVYDSNCCTFYLKTQNNDVFNQEKAEVRAEIMINILLFSVEEEKNVTEYVNLFSALEDSDCPCVFHYFSDNGKYRDFRIKPIEWSNSEK